MIPGPTPPILPPHLWRATATYDGFLMDMSVCGDDTAGKGGYWASEQVFLKGPICTFTWWTNMGNLPDVDGLQATLGYQNLRALTADPACGQGDCTAASLAGEVTSYGGEGGQICTTCVGNAGLLQNHAAVVLLPAMTTEPTEVAVFNTCHDVVRATAPANTTVVTISVTDEVDACENKTLFWGPPIGPVGGVP
jgi:hypothetical protein